MAVILSDIFQVAPVREWAVWKRCDIIVGDGHRRVVCKLWNDHVEKTVQEGHSASCQTCRSRTGTTPHCWLVPTKPITWYPISLCLIMTVVHLYLFYGKIITSRRYIWTCYGAL